MTEDEKYYQPKGKPERLSTRAKIPKSSLGLNKRAIIVLACSVAALVGIVFLSALSPSREEVKVKANTKWNPNPSEVVQGLPNDYDERQRRKEAEERRRKFEEKIKEPTSVITRKVSAEEKILEEYQISRLKDAIKARESDLEFRGVSQKLGGGFGGLLNGGNISLNEIAGQGSSSFGSNPRDDDNRQDDKENFLNRKFNDGTHLSSNLVEPKSKYELMAGTLIPGLMLSGVNSDLPGHIVGQVSQNTFDSVTGKYLLLPQGAKIVGLYDSKVTYGQERVLIVWNRIIFPNGKSISLEGMPGTDMSGYAGVKDKVNNHYLRLLTGVVLGSIVGAGSQVAYGNYQNVNPDFGQLALQGAAQNVNQAGQRITQKNLNIQPTLEIRPGLRFNIFVTKDVTLEPYES